MIKHDLYTAYSTLQVFNKTSSNIWMSLFAASVVLMVTMPFVKANTCFQ